MTKTTGPHGHGDEFADDDSSEIHFDELRSEALGVLGGGDHGLHAGTQWQTTELTFSFPDSSSQFEIQNGTRAYGTGESTDGFTALSVGQVRAAEYALAQYSAVSGLTFTKLENDEASSAVIRFGQSEQPSTAWAYYPSGFEEGGDVWLGKGDGFYADPEQGDYAWHTFLHETGHALGLQHGHDEGALEDSHDSMEYSVMTYSAFVGDPIIGGYSNEAGGYAQTLMQEDIAAVQALYGANYDHASGNTRYKWDPDTGVMTIDGVAATNPVENKVFLTVWDGGGRDWYDFGDYKSDLSVDLSPGAASLISNSQTALLNDIEEGATVPIFASGNIYNAQLHDGDKRALIENALGGTGDDFITGNAVANKLFGGAGNDHLIGGGGRDKLKGGGGADHLSGGAGRDKLEGKAGTDRLEGGGRADTLKGGGGADILIGGGGNDKLVGGVGRDQFKFDEGFGVDRIIDFKVGEDLIDLSDYAITYEALSFSGARINLIDGDVIRMFGFDAATLDESNFIF
ncbi:MAG: M10 family metallopeptidase C-terminal domain-containing protein [Pikeienuella sp.]